MAGNESRPPGAIGRAAAVSCSAKFSAAEDSPPAAAPQGDLAADHEPDPLAELRSCIARLMALCFAAGALTAAAAVWLALGGRLP